MRGKQALPILVPAGLGDERPRGRRRLRGGGRDQPQGDEDAGEEPQGGVDGKPGVQRLRVIDASIFPRITSGNTNAPTYVIAEKGARAILKP